MYDFINTKYKNTLTAKITPPPENGYRNGQKPRAAIIIGKLAHMKEKHLRKRNKKTLQNFTVRHIQRNIYKRRTAAQI